MEPFELRGARPDELAALVAIDDAASALYLQAGLAFAFAQDDPFVVAEAQRWAEAIEGQRAQLAVDREDRPIAFVTLGIVDDAPYLDQIAVHPTAMRRGVGTALLRYALAWSGARPLWLTTYAHLAWNRAYYARHGFVAVPEPACGPELRAILAQQRAALPAPEQRIAMVHRATEPHLA